MDLQDYRAKVSRYVNEHGDTLTIYKLMHDIPLSSGDYQELSRVLTGELGSHEDYRWEFGDTPFGLLIRKIRLRWIALGCVKLKMSFQREIN